MLLLATGIRFLPQLLVVGNEPTPADAIVALSGDGDGSRLRAATRLYDQGLAPLLVHVNGQKMTKATVQKLCPDCKLEEKQVVFLEGSTDTRTDAELSLQYCRANNLRTLLVVTSPYHSRRTRFIFNDIFDDAGTGGWGLGTGPLEVTVISSNDYGNLIPPAGRWWLDRKTLEFVWLEFGKSLYWELTPFMEFQGEGTRLKESELAR